MALPVFICIAPEAAEGEEPVCNTTLPPVVPKEFPAKNDTLPLISLALSPDWTWIEPPSNPFDVPVRISIEPLAEDINISPDVALSAVLK